MYIRLNTTTRLITIDQLLPINPDAIGTSDFSERKYVFTFEALRGVYVNRQFHQSMGIESGDVANQLNFNFNGLNYTIMDTPSYSDLFGSVGGIYIDNTFHDPVNLTLPGIAELIMNTISQ